MHRLLRSLTALTFAAVLTITAHAAWAQANNRESLPQEHPYQKQLRDYLATLTEKDFEPDRSKPFTAVAPADADEAYKLWVVQLEPPRVGLKRSAASVNSLSKNFTLASIESDQGVMKPSAWAEPLAYLANWNYAGNPYYNSRAIKLRAFATTVVDLLMMDNIQEHSQARMHQRSDWFGPHLVEYAYVYASTRDVLPEPVKKAFEECLKKMIRRVAAWGPTADETWLDVSVTTGLGIASKTLNDPEISKIAEDYAKQLYTNGRFYNDAGYFVDQGCFDTAFSGLTLYFATWTAGSSDWPFAKEAVARAWKLRGYLMLPEPDGTIIGPSHMTYRAGADVAHDQWNFPFRNAAAGFVTDEAAAQSKYPTPAQLKEAPEKVAGAMNAYLRENTGQQPVEKIMNNPWRWSMWTNSGAFPMVNFAHDMYPKGYAAKREQLEQSSALAKLPFQRDQTFLEKFSSSFVIAKEPAYGVVVHTGPVGAPPGAGSEIPEFQGPYGLGGGTLSAFWTKETGSVILGRRAGMAIFGADVKSFDKVEEWISWPIHAVSGANAEGKYFSSARITKPSVEYQADNTQGSVSVSGTIPAESVPHLQALQGKIDYSRKFNITPKALKIETTVKSDGVDKLSEMYEVLPVFHNDGRQTVTTTIEFQSGGAWTAATPEAKEGVTAIRLTRFNGAVIVTFDKPQRVKLSPADWKDNYLAGGLTCRNVLVDLLGAAARPATFKEATVSYTIAPAAK